MTDLKAQIALLAQLEREHDEAQVEIDQLIAEMGRVPPEQRSDSDWGPSGKLTKRFLELSSRQNEIAAEMRLASKAIEQATPPQDPNKTVN
jgi:hypothetical protein